ncbi:MAG: DNA primase [Bdellovibrionota bacterium]
MIKFTPEFIERVAEANNIVDLISQQTQLRSAGGGLMGRCPFPDHKEKTPSFSVSETKQVYHCFGCHKSGNIFSFLRDFQGLSFPEAVEFLADRAGISLPKPTGESVEIDKAMQRRKQLLAANKWALIFFREQLKRQALDHPVKKYIQKRELIPETLETFQMGYAPADWDGLVNFLTSKGVSMEIAEEARLVKARTQGKTGYFDLFRDRLIFPILNNQGEPVAFGGRIIESGEPKYLNSPETPVFVKGKILYGLFQTARYIRSEDTVLIVEGYMDLISLYQVGIRNVVATMGTALTPEHGRFLKRLTKNVVVLFDGDSAGQEAAERSLPLLLACEIFPKGLILPDNQDPDDFVKSSGPEELTRRVKQAPDLFSLNLSQWMKTYRGDASEKIQLIDRLKSLFRVISDRRLLDLYLQESAQKLSVGVPWLKQALGAENINSHSRGIDPKHTRNVSDQKVDTETGKNVQTIEVEYRLKSAPVAELLLLALSLKSRANLLVVENENIIESLSSESVKKLLIKSFDVYRQNPERFDRLVSQLMTSVDEPRFLFHADLELGRESSAEQKSEERLVFDEEMEQKLLKDALKRIRENSLRGQLKKLALDLKVNPTPEKMQLMMSLQKDLSSLNRREII